MSIYVSLFSASVALAGFVAVFLVFRYQTMDSRVDKRKSRIRSLLEKEINDEPSIDIKIQNIGKKESEENDICFFCELINREITDGELANRTKNAVNEFVRQINAYWRLRDFIVRLGLASIFTWGVLSLIYLLIYVVSPCMFSSVRCLATVILSFSVFFFTVSMVLTLCFVRIALRKKPK